MTVVYKKEMRPYQLEMMREVKNTWHIAKTIPIISSTVGSGKTFMAGGIMEEIISSEPDARILCLAEGQDVLRHQMSETVKEDYPSLKHEIYTLTKASDIGKAFNHKIVVTLPQTIEGKKLPIGVKITHLIVDEAHNRFSAKQMKGIISSLKPKKILLLTGTPSKFVRENKFKKKYNIIIKTMLDIYADSLKTGKLIFPKSINTYISTIDVTRKDIDSISEIRNRDGNIKEEYHSKIFTYKDELVEKALKGVFKTQMELLGYTPNQLDSLFLNNSWLNSLNIKTKELFNVKKDLGKTLIVCYDIAFAEYIHDVLNGLGLTSLISTSKSYQKNKDDYYNVPQNIIDDFERKDDIKCLIVVNRCRLGFNMPKLQNIIDLTGSRNLDLIFQMFGRLCRVDENNPNVIKNYYKIAFEKEYVIARACMLSALSLVGDNMYIYDGTNGKTLRIPPDTTGDGIPPEGGRVKKKNKIIQEGVILNCLDVFKSFYSRRRDNYSLRDSSSFQEVLEQYGEYQNISFEHRFRKANDWVKENKKYPTKDDTLIFTFKTTDGDDVREFKILEECIHPCVLFNSSNFDEDKYAEWESIKNRYKIEEANELRQALLYRLTKDKKIEGNLKYGDREYSIFKLYYKFKYEDTCHNFSIFLDRLNISDVREETIRFVKEWISENGEPNLDTIVMRNGKPFKLGNYYYEMLHYDGISID
jgi:superfamily II DNA or RNA helicase